jgi:hypothetical protein
LHAVVREEGLPDQVRRLQPLADTEIHRGLAEVHRQQLRMAIGEVQQVHIAARRQVVQAGEGLASRPARGAAGQRGGHRGSGQHAQEFAPVQAHGFAGAGRLTGEAGSNR